MFRYFAPIKSGFFDRTVLGKALLIPIFPQRLSHYKAQTTSFPNIPDKYAYSPAVFPPKGVPRKSQIAHLHL